jgi:clan AA aspartic protease (TIGR02281 family)
MLGRRSIHAEKRARMLSWALRYLGVAVLVAAAFAAVRGEDVGRWLADRPPSPTSPATDIRLDVPADLPVHGVVIPGTRDGHFLVQAVVEGVAMDFMVDTGASQVVLTMADAERLGWHRHRLEFSRRYQTANGVVRGAPVTLRELRIGQYSLYDIDAAVIEGALGISLLGMSFLERLDSYAVRNGRLVLNW